jgi:hypothetical protein
MYWLTALYDTGTKTAAQDELHIELADPPQENAAPEQYRALSLVFPVAPIGQSLTWCISPVRIRDEVRAAGLRIV